MTRPDEHDETEGEANLAGKHSRNWTPDTSRRVEEELRKLGETQGSEGAVEHADKSKPPEGKPSKPA